MTSLVLHEALSMTSLEISKLVEKRHDNVKRTIEAISEKGIIVLPQIEEVEDTQSLSPNNRSKVYVFSGPKGKRDSIVVVAQLSPEFTARLVDRWQELELQNTIPPPPNPLFAILDSIRLEKRRASSQNYNVLMQRIEIQGREQGLTLDAIRDWKISEAELLNTTVMGFPSWALKNWYELTVPIRDHFPLKILAAYAYLESIETALIVSHTPIAQRAETLEVLLATNFPDVLAYRNEQVKLVNQRTATREWDLMPQAPIERPSLHVPNEVSRQLGFDGTGYTPKALRAG